MGGWIKIFTGPMFARKTDELLIEVKRYLLAKKKVVLFKHSIDSRYSHAEIVSHDGRRMEAIPVSSSDELRSLIPDDADVIAVDEVQFFDQGIVGVVKDLAKSGKTVLLAGLDKDFRGDPFGPMPYLLAIADDVVKLTAVCTVCGGPATMSQRLIDGKPAPKTSPTILVAGKESYEPRCRAHHIVID
ncbi:thymidine kinase [Candidatus Methanodesulfokora washburnensis]|jgi:thymidine kinase|uniref:Thymidine kinase n=1 Tax=Candidatus Methanodesulfokora washburnensis TaxID=2478471 RepID=A0A3R9QXD1_9CREN|nr:thymidine kinase [Candidatus Methanodesulfokores washburnensis]RSN74342.1 thymidine kinase [Candidatus Methanodesulfokores washburnensis]